MKLVLETMAASLPLQNGKELMEQLARIWAEVRYCSEHCRRPRSFMDQL
jgi:hypothetical protein